MLLAAARERAETERINAELDRLRAQYQLEELLAIQREQRRSRQTEQIVSRTIDVLPEKERDQVEQRLRQALLDVVDVADEASVVAIVRRAIDEARAEMEAAQREAVQRLRLLQQQRITEAQQRAPAQAIEHVSSRTPAWRGSRVDNIVSGLANELAALGHPTPAIACASDAARQQLATLDDRVLGGASWPDFAARAAASVALGFQQPVPPGIWDPVHGWRWLQPGD